MPTNILMPALSPTMEKGNLAKWLKAVGDTVKSGDVIAEIETDKATMEVEAVDEGTLAAILVPAGTQDVAVNTPIAVIAAEGEDVSAAAAAPAPKAAPAPAPTVSAGPAPVAASGERIFASPLARRVAKEKGLDLAKIAGSGPRGRIVLKDVEAAAASGTAKAGAPASAAAAAPAAASPAAAAPVALPTGPSEEAILRMFEPGSYETIPHDGMRKTIAKRLMESKLTVPHFYLTVDTELDALLGLREQINAAAPVRDGKPAYKVSVNDFVIKAMAVALQRVPDANVTWTDGAMLKHRHSDVGVAVSIPGGLITPVVRRAETKTLSAISNEMKDFAARAKARKLKPEEYQGGSTAVSNLGMFGIKDFAAIINPPHATILAVGAGEKRVVVKGGQPAVATVMTVTLSTDHRAVDGALGAELLAAFKALIENPMGMLV
ncbi:pyruvate dehydrogenase complex dihydrolipoamide acetyltransferase [Pinisolibacter sp.]|uniref:pyruvate dehydrogenase complex dihydrolipoamide acetyltransferase n=1 Tax=Pinisolibacter sp. TaxID=2172024 RepID=UPI002FDE6DCE